MSSPVSWRLFKQDASLDTSKMFLLIPYLFVYYSVRMSTWSATVKGMISRTHLNLVSTNRRSSARVVESLRWVSLHCAVLFVADQKRTWWWCFFMFPQCQRTVKMRVMLYCTLLLNFLEGEMMIASFQFTACYLLSSFSYIWCLSFCYADMATAILCSSSAPWRQRLKRPFTAKPEMWVYHFITFFLILSILPKSDRAIGEQVHIHN